MNQLVDIEAAREFMKETLAKVDKVNLVEIANTLEKKSLLFQKSLLKENISEISKEDFDLVLDKIFSIRRKKDKLYEFISFEKLNLAVNDRSMGIVRGKNDKIDAQRIADYAYRRRDKLEFSVLPSKMIFKIQKLLSLRETMVKQRAGYKVTVQENSRILVKSEYKCFFEAQNKLVKSLTTQICKVEEEIKLIITSDFKLENTYNLITSISGVGFIVAAYFISTTSCFTKFKNGRKYACYCGTAPFEYSSGTSIHFKTRVNPMANKKMKSLLNMSARSAITCDPELKEYYHRKVEQGKNKMSTLNIIRNKIIHRVFAVVNRGTPYVVLQNHLS